MLVAMIDPAQLGVIDRYGDYQFMSVNCNMPPIFDVHVP